MAPVVNVLCRGISLEFTGELEQGHASPSWLKIGKPRVRSLATKNCSKPFSPGRPFGVVEDGRETVGRERLFELDPRLATCLFESRDKREAGLATPDPRTQDPEARPPIMKPLLDRVSGENMKLI